MWYKSYFAFVIKYVSTFSDLVHWSYMCGNKIYSPRKAYSRAIPYGNSSARE